MSGHDPRIDAYIARSAEFARPVLTYLRDLAHDTCPGIEETIKWGFPHFVHHGIVFSMAAFKAHCALHFWRGEQVTGSGSDEAMGQFGKITSLKDLPSRKILVGHIKKAVAFNASGEKPARAKAPPKPAPTIPPFFAAALKANKEARKTFEAFGPGNQREYVDWLIEAKTEATREKRLATAIEWLAEGKPRLWKYQK
jgi:uncharacterized protein YdeI (YjbR/CyaY-like superfamily)